MLVNCPECKSQISSMAIQCPHCGYPVTQIETKPRKKRTHRRLPNGFGQISKIKGNLTKPYRAMVTVGRNENGRPLVKLLKPVAYFKTYNDAYEALLKYNHDHPSSDMKLTDLYAKWSTEYYECVTPGTARIYKQVWRRSEPLHAKNIASIVASDIRLIVDSVSLSLKPRVMCLFSLMFDYAVQYEYLDKNVARNIKLPRSIAKEIDAERREHLSFTEEELAALWQHKDDPLVATILIQCYTGFRPQELLNITKDSVDLENWTITGGMKTEAGKDRIVPVHTAIRPLLLQKYNQSYQALFPGSYPTYYRRFLEKMRELGFSEGHRPHDPRKCFITMAKAANINEYAIKRIVGHSITDLTEKIYTERPVSWLSEEIEKIRV